MIHSIYYMLYNTFYIILYILHFIYYNAKYHGKESINRLPEPAKYLSTKNSSLNRLFMTGDAGDL